MKSKVTMVNQLEQRMSEIQTGLLRGKSKAAANKGFKEMAGDVLIQAVVLLKNSSGGLIVYASKSATS